MSAACALLLLLGSLARAADVEQGSAVMGGVVRSKEWRVRRTPKREEEFIGEVSYHGADSDASSDWALYREATRSWKARGHVRVERRLASGDTALARGDEARFDQAAAEGALWAKDRVTFERRTSPGGPDYGSAGRLEWQGQQRAHFSGQVRIWGPRLESWSDEADYDKAAGKLTFAGGRPVVKKVEGDWTGVVKADKVAAFESPRRLEADGKAVGWIEFPQKEQPEALRR
jgi:hypothetical protein